MSTISDVLKRAINAMSPGATPIDVANTIATDANDIKINDKFLDTNGAEYTVERINKNNGIVAIYAHTETNNADGWFTRESYNVLQ